MALTGAGQGGGGEGVEQYVGRNWRVKLGQGNPSRFGSSEIRARWAGLESPWAQGAEMAPKNCRPGWECEEQESTQGHRAGSSGLWENTMDSLPLDQSLTHEVSDWELEQHWVRGTGVE